MANVFAPNGFSPESTSNGPMNFRISQRRIASSAGAIYHGDAVVPVTSTANGYIKQATAGTVPLAGIFWGCQYLSVSQKRTVWNNYWPGSDANGDVIAYVIDDPNSRFIVQTSGASFQISGTLSAYGSSPVGQLCQLNVGTGNTLSGISGMFVDTIGTTATYPFIVTNLVTNPPGVNGTDPTSQYNYIEVGFNNEWLRGNGAVTGIS